MSSAQAAVLELLRTLQQEERACARLRPTHDLGVLRQRRRRTMLRPSSEAAGPARPGPPRARGAPQPPRPPVHLRVDRRDPRPRGGPPSYEGLAESCSQWLVQAGRRSRGNGTGHPPWPDPDPHRTPRPVRSQSTPDAVMPPERALRPASTQRNPTGRSSPRSQTALPVAPARAAQRPKQWTTYTIELKRQVPAFQERLTRQTAYSFAQGVRP